MSKEETEKSLGEKRVRTDFNVSGSGNVNFIKQKTAELINVLEDFKNDPRNEVDGETSRLIATAQTRFEEAAMWGVKSVTN